MNKLIIALVFLLSISGTIAAQVGIGTTSPETSAALDVSSADKGFLMPRMTTAQREAIPAPANGLMVFDTDTNSQWTNTGGAWGETKAGVGKFVDGATPDIAYYAEKVGIGINAFGSAHKLYVEGKKSTDNANTAVRIDAIYDGTGTSTSTYGIGAIARNNSSGTIAYAIGSQGIIQNVTGGTITTAVGSYPQIFNSGTINYGSGMIVENFNSAGSMTTGRGMDVSLVNAAGASIGTGSLASMYATNNGTITGDAYGLFIGGAAAGTVGGNSYALYVATPFSNVVGNAFAIYSDNLNDSYIEGNLGIGTNDPLQKVHVSGVLRLEPQATPPVGGAGDLYAGTDNKLYFHDGTSWQEIQFVP